MAEAGRGELDWKELYFPRGKRETEALGISPPQSPTSPSKRCRGGQAFEQSHLEAPNRRPTLRQMQP